MITPATTAAMAPLARGEEPRTEPGVLMTRPLRRVMGDPFCGLGGLAAARRQDAPDALSRPGVEPLRTPPRPVLEVRRQHPRPGGDVARVAREERHPGDLLDRVGEALLVGL